MLEKIIELIPELLKLGLVGVIGYLFGEWNTKRKWRRGEDSRALKQLISSLPTFQRIEQHFYNKNLADSFKTDIYHDFHDVFQQMVSNPAQNFLDSDLNKLVCEIEKMMDEFLGIVAIDTFPTKVTGEQSIRRIKYGDQTDDFQTAEKLNKLATEVYEKYKELIKTARDQQISVPDSK